MCGAPRARRDGDPLIGDVIADRYLLRERLGHGSSGTIYLAEHVTLRRRCAVKVLHHELARDDLAVERFRREATTVGHIDNEHIVEVLDFGRAGDGRLFLAMEYLEGETLASLLEREQRLQVGQVVDILSQLGEALMEAHAMGYIHRDLRPRNVFLARRRRGDLFVKLLDFGLAKLVEKEGDATSTNLGMTFGDPRYMSPEQAQGEHFDRRADIYALGVIAFQMLVGQPPFVGEKVFDVLTKHLEDAPPEPSSVREDVPTWLDAIVLRMLAKDPEERFVTVYRLVEALRDGQNSGRIMSDDAARSMPAQTPPPPAPRPPRRETAILPKREVAAASADPSGMSGQWFAEGDELPAKPSGSVSLPVGDHSRLMRFEEGRRDRRGFLIAGVVVAVLAAAVVLIAIIPGGGSKPARPAAGAQVPPPTPTPAPPPTPAPAASPPDAATAIAATPPDAAAPIAAAPPPDAALVASSGQKGLPVAKPVRPPRTSVAKTHGTPSEKPPQKPSEKPPEPAVEKLPAGADAAQAEFFVKLGQKAVKEGDVVGAAANFNKARGFDPKNADAIAGLGEVALQQGYAREAVVHLGAAARLAPRSARIQTLLGNAYLASEQPKPAAAAFRKALNLQPDNEQARRGYEEAERLQK